MVTSPSARQYSIHIIRNHKVDEQRTEEEDEEEEITSEVTAAVPVAAFRSLLSIGQLPQPRFSCIRSLVEYKFKAFSQRSPY